MPNPKLLLHVCLVATGLAYGMAWFRAQRSRAGTAGSGGSTRPRAPHLFIGFVAEFLDTLGIGSFATTTSFYKLFGTVRDELIPGTLNAGVAIPTVFQALIYTTIIEVDMWTLVLMIGASVLGAWLGAGIVASWPRRKIQIGMGLALMVAAALMLMTQLNLFPLGGETLGLTGLRLWIGLVGNFALGALMTLGIGLYGPCIILVSLLGMNPRAAFPIMMSSCVFLMPVASMRFIRKGSYDLAGALGLTLAGIPAVLLAAFIVRALPLGTVRWLVVVIVVYTASMLLRSGFTESKSR